MIKKIYQNIFPLKSRLWINQHVRQPIELFRYYMYDMARFRRNYVGSGRMDREHRLARITALYHVLEKGLSFRDSRPLFGERNVQFLLGELKACLNDLDAISAVQWQSAVRVLEVYLERNRVQADAAIHPLIKKLSSELPSLRRHLSKGVGGGVVECHREDIQARAMGDFPKMALSRYSVRHFSNEPVAREVIERAIIWAQKSPSVCNRQASRIHAVTLPGLINEILAIHGGTRGFTEQIHTLLVVTGDLRILLEPTERNQIFLDTGIFSMSLLYGLHYEGVGTCPLHWCVSPDKDMELRKLVYIPDEETITTLIAVGSLPETFQVAHSQRRNLEDVLKWN